MLYAGQVWTIFMRFLTIQLICVDSRVLHYFTIRVAVESCPVFHHLLFYTELSDLYISLITYILLDVLVWNVAVYFYKFCSIFTSPQGESKYKERVKIYSDIVHQNIS